MASLYPVVPRSPSSRIPTLRTSKHFRKHSSQLELLKFNLQRKIFIERENKLCDRVYSAGDAEELYHGNKRHSLPPIRDVASVGGLAQRRRRTIGEIVSSTQATASQLAEVRRISAKRRQHIPTSPDMPHLPPLKSKGFSQPTISKHHHSKIITDQKRQFVDFADSPAKHLSSSAERIRTRLSSSSEFLAQSPLLKDDDIVTENNKISISLSKSRGRSEVQCREVKRGNSNPRSPQSATKAMPRRNSLQNGKYGAGPTKLTPIKIPNKVPDRTSNRRYSRERKPSGTVEAEVINGQYKPARQVLAEQRRAEGQAKRDAIQHKEQIRRERQDALDEWEEQKRRAVEQDVNEGLRSFYN